MDLAADIAEGEVKPHEGHAGAAQDFGGESDVCLEGKAKSMEGSGASALDSKSRNTARPSKRQGGSREPNNGYETREHFEGQANSMKVRGVGNNSC